MEDDGTFVLTEPEPREDRELIPEDEILEAKVLGAQIVERGKNDDGTPRKRVEFRFQVVDPGEYEGRKVKGSTTTNFVDHPDCKLRSWSTEMLGVDSLPVGFKLQLGSLVDQKCRIVIEERSFTGRDGDEVTYNQVKEIIRSRQSGYSSEEPF